MEADLIVAGTSISTLIVSIIQILKTFAPDFVKKGAPLIAIFLGVTASFLYNISMHEVATVFQVFVIGMSMGFQSSGIYAATTGSIKEEKKQIEGQLKTLSEKHELAQEQIKILSEQANKKEN